MKSRILLYTTFSNTLAKHVNKGSCHLSKQTPDNQAHRVDRHLNQLYDDKYIL